MKDLLRSKNHLGKKIIMKLIIIIIIIILIIIITIKHLLWKNYKKIIKNCKKL